MPSRGKVETDGEAKVLPQVQWRYLAAALVLITVSLSAIGVAAAAASPSYKLPEIVLTLLLLFGVVVLLGSIGALVILLAGFNLTDDKEALGLPGGSVRAIIALTLILVFAIVSVFLFWNSGHVSYDSTGLTKEQIDLLPRDSIVSIVATGATFSVKTMDNQFANQLALQLMTTLGTLVTAVAAFYFGAKSVSVGADLAKKAANDATANVADAAKAATEATAKATDAAKTAEGSKAGTDATAAITINAAEPDATAATTIEGATTTATVTASTTDATADAELTSGTQDTDPDGNTLGTT